MPGASPKLQYAPYPGLTPTLAEALNAVTKPVSSVFVSASIFLPRIAKASKIAGGTGGKRAELGMVISGMGRSPV